MKKISLGTIAVLLLIVNIIIFSNRLDVHSTVSADKKEKQDLLHQLNAEVTTEKNQLAEIQLEAETVQSNLTDSEKKYNEAQSILEEVTELYAEKEDELNDIYESNKRMGIDSKVIDGLTDDTLNSTFQLITGSLPEDGGYTVDYSSDNYDAKVSSNTYTYFLYSYANIVTVFQFNDKEEFINVYNIDVEENAIISEKSYSPKEWEL